MYKVANPIAGCEIGKPLSEALLAKYYEWLRTLAEEPFDPKDVHSICAHCRHKDLGMVQARDYLEECFD